MPKPKKMEFLSWVFSWVSRGSESTSIVILIFILFLSAVAFSSLLLFVLLTKVSGAAYLLSSPPADDWSQAADAMNAVFGLPIALAGSLVAIALAHRAFVLAKRQVQYETLRYLDDLVHNVSEVYWELAESVRSVDRFGDRLYRTIVNPQAQDSLRSARWDTSLENDTAPARVDEATENALVSAELDFRSSVQRLSAAILSIVRDPVAREVWMSFTGTRSQDGAVAYMASLSTSAEGTYGRRYEDISVLGRDFLDLSPQGLSQALLQGAPYMGLSELSEVPFILQFDNSIVKYKYNVESEKFCINTVKKTRNKESDVMISAKIIDELSGMEVFEKNKTHRGLAQWRGASSADRIRTVGALFHFHPLLAKDGPHGKLPFFNVGAAVICEVLSRLPDDQTLDTALQKALSRRGETDHYTMQVAHKLMSDKAVNGYFSPWMLDGVKNLEADGRKFLTRNPRHFTGDTTSAARS